jgi:hypothetical protein
MKFFCLIIIALSFSVLDAQVERVIDLGDGYDAALIAGPSNSTFESIGHWEYLRYRQLKICRLGAYSLSPDKTLLCYQEASKGKVYVYMKSSGAKTELCSAFPGLIRHFDWVSKPGSLVLTIVDGDNIELQLPKKK